MESWAEETSYLPDSVTLRQTPLNKANPFHTRPLLNDNNRGPWKKNIVPCPSSLTYCISKCITLTVASFHIYEQEGYRISNPFHVCCGSHRVGNMLTSEGTETADTFTPERHWKVEAHHLNDVLYSVFWMLYKAQKQACVSVVWCEGDYWHGDSLSDLSLSSHSLKICVKNTVGQHLLSRK